MKFYEEFMKIKFVLVGQSIDYSAMVVMSSVMSLNWLASIINLAGFMWSCD